MRETLTRVSAFWFFIREVPPLGECPKDKGGAVSGEEQDPPLQWADMLRGEGDLIMKTKTAPSTESAVKDQYKMCLWKQDYFLVPSISQIPATYLWMRVASITEM